LIPKGIGIATSLKGAGLQDMIRTIKNVFHRQTFIFLLLSYREPKHRNPSSAQSTSSTDYDVEVIIVGRGGGSFEDLNCFNSERLLMRYSIKKPIICGVGHETDFTRFPI
jgi:exodeoxyribonuclease VII large subunit